MLLEKTFSKTEREKIARANVDFKDGDLLEILNEGEWRNFVYKDRQAKKLVFLIKTSLGEEKFLPLNQQSINNLIDGFGNDTTQWIGKKVRVWVFKSNVGGKFVDVVYLTPPDWIFENNQFIKKSEKGNTKSQNK